jgi:hypothetical protein
LIPPFTTAGLLPPFVGTDPTDILGVSPYATDPLELVQQLGTSPERQNLLRGLLSWRAALLGVDIKGFQWINGSFCEDIETTERRAPRDIDVITFVDPPQPLLANSQWTAFVNGRPDLFSPNEIKRLYGCHAFMVDLSSAVGSLIWQTTYWFGLFSHKRVTLDWKGVLEIPLPDNDAAAVALLNTSGTP